MTATTGPLPAVAIIGAGLTGLLLAQGLQKNGFSVALYDKEAFLGERTREWTMLLHWAWPVICKMLPDDILADLNDAYTDPSYPFSDEHPESIPFFNGVTGQIAFRATVKARRVSRTRFRRLCTRGLNIQWAKTVKDLSIPEDESGAPVTILFEDGTSTTADLVIGADGPNSFVRRWLLGDEAAKPVPTPVAGCNGIAKYPTAEISAKIRAPHPIFSLISGPGIIMMSAVQDVPDPDDPSTWSFHTIMLWNDANSPSLTGDAAVAKMKDRMNSVGFAEPFHSAVNEIPEGSNFFLSQFHYWCTQKWDGRGGRVTIAGDAAHSMLPVRGQGFNQALKDVEVLFEQFLAIKEGSTTLEEAMKVYEEEVYERGKAAVQGSLDDAKDLMRVEGLEEGRTAKTGFARLPAGGK